MLPVPTDVISIDKTGEHFRLIYDVKGRFTVHRITAEEAKVRPLVQLLPPSRFRSSSSLEVGRRGSDLELLCSSVCSTSCAR